MGIPDARGTAEAAPDWRCRFCGTANGGGADHCRSCRSSRGAAATDADVSTVPVSASASRRRPRHVITLVAIALAAAALGAATVYVARRPGAEVVTVAGFEWERTVEIQERQTVREESWKEEVPENARVIARRREVHHVERQQAGTRDGQPVYRQHPVYGQRVAYDVDRWSTVRTVRASGKDQSPRWPDVRLSLGEREGRRGETYVVVLQGRSTHRVPVPRARWQEMREGQIGTAVLDKDGTLLELR